MPSFIDKDGSQQQVTLSPTIWREAEAAALTVPQLLNTKYPTTGETSTFEQLCVSSGLIVRPNTEFGIRPPSLAQIFDGSTQIGAGVVQDADPASRVLFPAVVLELIESKMAVDRTTDPSAFDRMIARDTSVSSNRLIQPVIDYTKAEAKRPRAISQLAAPDHMLSITASDKTSALPVVSIGMQISDQALHATTLDFVSMAVTRQTEIERATRVYEYLLSFLNGDPDSDTASTDALTPVNADTFDSTISANGVITMKALISWLVEHQLTSPISHLVCGLDTYLALQGLLSTTNTNTYPEGSLTPKFNVMNRAASSLEVMVLPSSAGWTANTIMGIDSRYGIHRIRNSAASYSAIEQFVLRRATELRFDFSEVCVRMFKDAFNVLALINS